MLVLERTDTVLDIWNSALGFIGCRSVASPDEQTPEARICAQFYDRARMEVLRAFPWGFASSRWRLAPKALPEVYAGAWAYAYAWPPKCAAIRNVSDGKRAKRCLYAVRSHEGERLILTDVRDAVADMTEDVRDPAMWDEGFRETLARRLACLIVVPLMRSPARLGELVQLYQEALRNAKHEDAQEEPPLPIRDNWLDPYFTD